MLFGELTVRMHVDTLGIDGVLETRQVLVRKYRLAYAEARELAAKYRAKGMDYNFEWTSRETL